MIEQVFSSSVVVFVLSPRFPNEYITFRRRRANSCNWHTKW